MIWVALILPVSAVVGWLLWQALIWACDDVLDAFGMSTPCSLTSMDSRSGWTLAR